MLALSSAASASTKAAPAPYYLNHSGLLSFSSSSPSPSTRQPSFIETPSQRRTRLAFLHKPTSETRGADNSNSSLKRVENWVQEQVKQSAFMITAAAAASTRPSRMSSSKGHRRTQSLHLHHLGSSPSAGKVAVVPDDVILCRMLKESSNLPSISEEKEEVEEEGEPRVFYATPLTLPTSYYYPTPISVSMTKMSTSSTSATKPLSHRRRNSDLEVIPEALEK